ncbi:Gfo/Idh/MocA family protein [Conexibacter woesei]|uniref:Oxidoreductase domain protein n=1 Tax=Conexibacter woesei (strain DSM 14684 / CCUG 47730 / CIP 108061 / JCM 11494 / NBRC 100937 / ID131577) TaxID=469383 RepID=D3FCC3_CONWI|nr:Gfo/Idh/MocA family oxidoreductase [Conexibacter woesei]ADB53418.1 oxidoreductase domain protein [Conexibacter woesei DSM 14684]
MRIALIGCGWIVERSHVPALRDAVGIEVVAVADTSIERAQIVAKALGLPQSACTTDHRALLDRADVDAVSIGTPPDSHRALVEEAAAAGKHVLCEKPLATTLADADAILAACERAGVQLGLFHNYLWYPETQEALKLIREGAIGEVVATEISGFGLRPWVGAEQGAPGWRHRLGSSGGGALMDAGVHALYLTEAYHGAPAERIGATVRRGDDGVDTWAFCQLHFPGGGFGMVNVAWGEGDARLSIMGTEGHITFLFDEGTGYYGMPARGFKVGRVGSDGRIWHRPLTWYRLFMPELFSDFAAAVDHGEPSRYAAHGAEGRRAIELALGAYRAAEEGATVALPLTAADPVYERGYAALTA